MAPRFTILLPTHNRADVLGFAIDSVLAQTDPDFELLIVGDGCTDNTAEVVASRRDSRIRWFDLPKAPAFGYANRNLALREAAGELVAFMAHDDLYLPDHLELMAAQFVDARVEWAYSRPLWVTDDGTIVPFAVDLTMADQLERFLNTHNLIPALCVVYRRELHERVGYWPEDVSGAADWHLWTAILRSGDGRNAAYLRTPTTFHFRADWRTGPAWGPQPLTAWLDAADLGWWPPNLRVEVGADGPQATFARKIGEGERWVADLRAGVGVAVDALAVNESVAIGELADRLGRDSNWWSGDLTRAVDSLDYAAQLARHDADREHHDADLARHDAKLAGQHTDLARAEVKQVWERVAAAQAETAQARIDAHAALGRAELAERELALANARAERELALANAREEREMALASAQAHATNGLLSPPVIGFVSRLQRKSNLRVRRNPLFDEAWYRQQYPDAASLDAYQHWRSQGWREGRDPNAWFSTTAYLAANPDVERSGINPLDHFYVRGISEQRSPRGRG